METLRKEDMAISDRMDYILDAVYMGLKIQHQRTKKEKKSSRILQINGVDTIINGIGNTVFANALWVDEKSANHYWNRPLDTFAFELSSKNNPEHKGWLLIPNATTHYMLIWPRATNKYLDHILSLELMLVSKQDLKRMITLYSACKLEDMEAHIQPPTSLYIFNDDIKVVQSSQLWENPVNVIVSKRLLLSIATYHMVLSEVQISLLLKDYEKSHCIC